MNSLDRGWKRGGFRQELMPPAPDREGNGETDSSDLPELPSLFPSLLLSQEKHQGSLTMLGAVFPDPRADDEVDDGDDEEDAADSETNYHLFSSLQVNLGAI